MLTVLLFEPYAVLRDLLRQWLELGLDCAVLQANDPAQLMALAETHQPRLILVDLDEWFSAGHSEMEPQHRLCPQPVWVGFGLDDTPEHRQRAEQSGITHFLPKAALQSDLMLKLQVLFQDKTK